MKRNKKSDHSKIHLSRHQFSAWMRKPISILVFMTFPYRHCRLGKNPRFCVPFSFPFFGPLSRFFFRRKLMAAEWLTDWLLWLFLPIRKKLSHSKYKIELNHQIVYCNYFLPKVNLSTFHDNEIVSLSFPISVSKDVSIIEGCSGKKLLQVRPENLMESYTNTNNQLIRAFVAKFENKKRFVFN